MVIKLTKAENRAAYAENEAEFYRKRFQEFGSNVETFDPGSDKLIVMEQWTLDPEPWGKYVLLDSKLSKEEVIGASKKRCVESIVSGLIERNLVQFIVKNPDSECPFDGYCSVAAKLYVVPWEKAPHERTIELKKYVENTLEEGGRL